jgi:hypothetical protein
MAIFYDRSSRLWSVGARSQLSPLCQLQMTLPGGVAGFGPAFRSECERRQQNAPTAPRGWPDGQVARGRGATLCVDRASSAARWKSTLHGLFQINDPTSARH